MTREIPEWVKDVIFWTQNPYLAKIFEKAGKNSEKALELLKHDHGQRAIEILEEIDEQNSTT